MKPQQYLIIKIIYFLRWLTINFIVFLTLVFADFNKKIMLIMLINLVM